MLWKRVSQQKLLSGEPSTSKKRKLSDTTQLKIDGRSWNSRRKSKRNRLKVTKKYCRAKKRRKMGDSTGENTISTPVDYISGLPEHITHHIISFLRCPKDAARTSILSKRWRRIWKSFLAFDFDQKNFKARGKSEREKFNNFVESSLTRRLAPLVCIQKFRLSMTTFHITMAPRIDRWLNAPISKDVKELEIHLESNKSRRYLLPPSILSCESLTVLKLYGCTLKNCNDMRLSNLQQLSMKRMRIDFNIIQSFISCCPVIEDLRLIHCTGLDSLHILTLLKLNRVEVHECHGLRQVEISIPYLQNFWFYGKRSAPCTINLDGCHDLRILTLKDTNMSDTLFQDQISKFPVLEILVLRECNTLERITILSEKLQRLSLIRCKKLLEAMIDAPKLRFFEFIGTKLPFSCIGAPNLYEAKICFDPIAGDKFNLLEFMGKFTHYKDLKLILSRGKDVTIYEELSDVHPDVLVFPSKNVKLEVKSSSFNMIEFVDNLLWATHPGVISVVSSSSSELLKFLHEKVSNREKKLNCCTYYSRKCWRHYLEHVMVSELEGQDCRNNFLNLNSRMTFFGLMWKSMGDKHAA